MKDDISGNHGLSIADLSKYDWAFKFGCDIDEYEQVLLIFLYNDPLSDKVTKLMQHDNDDKNQWNGTQIDCARRLITKSTEVFFGVEDKVDDS